MEREATDMETVMSGQSREEYIRTQRARYHRSTRAQKKRILDEGCEMFGMHRKSLTRAFGRPARRHGKQAGRQRQYGPALVGPLKAIWLAAEQPCGKRLKAVLPVWLPSYERHHGALDPAVREALLSASASTLDRLLRPWRVRYKGLSGTRAVRRLEGQIPIRTQFREVTGPGTFEADTVAHCGHSLAGAFVWTLTLTDIATGWTENRAVWNKSASQITARLREIERRLAFDIVAFDTDNGSEFINHVLYRYFHDRATPVHMTRCRPYHKNDQAHVEQKQWTHVRQLLGYERFEDRRLVELIDDLYRNQWRALQNFFLPTMQLQSKTREGGKIKRRHSRPATPYQRLLASDQVSPEAKEQLRREFESLDPFDLHKRIDAKLNTIFQVARHSQKGGKRNAIPAPASAARSKATAAGCLKNQLPKPLPPATPRKRPIAA